MTTSKLLSDARGYEQGRQWQMASDRYRRYLTGRPYSSHLETYVAYARCLRHTGDTIAAGRILDELVSSCSADETVLLERSALYESLMDWTSAQKVIQELVRLRPEKARYYFRLGRAQVGTQDFAAAKKSYRSGLTQTHRQGWDIVIRHIQSNLPGNSYQANSSYILLGGFDNLGGLEHRTETGEYFTKIVRARRDREKLFYDGLLTQHPQLSEISPTYHCSQDFDSLRYLTVQMLAPPDPAPELSEVIDISRTIQSVGYGDIGDQYSNPTYTFDLRLNTPSVVKGFTQIHRAYFNRQLFDTLHRLTASAEDADTAERIVTHLETIIMRNRLYVLISPPEHYTLLHGDFKPSNIMSDSSTHRFRVIDWQGFRIGPRFLDLAKYVVHAKTPYTRIKDEYLFNHGAGGLSTVEQIFFLYAYVLMVLLTSMRKPLTTGLAANIDPALSDMHKCVAQLKCEGFGSAMRTVESRVEQLDNQLTEQTAQIRHQVQDLTKLATRAGELNQHQASLSSANRALERRLRQLEQSTSWRMTAPLRRIARDGRRLARAVRARAKAVRATRR